VEPTFTSWFDWANIKTAKGASMHVLQKCDNDCHLQGRLHNHDSKQKRRITDTGEIDEYLGVKWERKKNVSSKLSKTLLVNQILTVLGFYDRTKPNKNSSLSSKISHRDADVHDNETTLNYKRIFRQLNFLEKST